MSPAPSVPEAPIRRLGLALTAAFALPAGGLIAYGTPFLLGDRTLTRPAAAIGRRGERTTFTNPYLDRFRAQFARGMIFSRDGKPLATNGAGQQADGSPARRYPLGSTTAQLVGWTTGGRFATLPDSVESAYESPLRGYREEDLPRLFRQRHNPVTRRRWPRPHNVYLTVSGRLQQYAAQRLRAAVRGAGGTGGAALLMDAATGEVLAAASEPSFDPTGLTVERMRGLIRQDRSRGLLQNKPLSTDAIFFPGSTFKLVTAAAALRRPVSGEAQCTGVNGQAISWEHDGRRYRRRPGVIHDFGRGGHGYLGLSERLDTALGQSCNVFFATLAARLGAEALREEMVHCELAHVPAERELADYLAEAGFGQVAVKVAPIELARIAAVAGVARTEESQGAVPRPYWVKRVAAAGGHTVRMEGLPGAPREDSFQPFEPAVAQRLRGMMLGVVNGPGGTAYRAFHRDGAPRLPGITVGGKTGTAELDVQVTTKSGKRATVRRQHAWFVGFAQKEDEVPVRTLAFVVLVEGARRGQTGGAVCAPVARDLVAQVLRPSQSAARVPREAWVDTLVGQGRRALEEWLAGPRSRLPSRWRNQDD